MNRIRPYLAYAWALLATPIVLITFMGMPALAKRLVNSTGLHVHPLYSGGEVMQTIDHPQYKAIVHRPVFDGLICDRSTGFVQIEWQPRDANLPDSIDESIDLDQDGKADLQIHVDTRTDQVRLDSTDSRVGTINEVIRVQNGRVVRINLSKRTK
jgi:hypothetical protein